MGFAVRLVLGIIAVATAISALFQGYVAINETIKQHGLTGQGKRWFFALILLVIMGFALYGASNPSSFSIDFLPPTPSPTVGLSPSPSIPSPTATVALSPISSATSNPSPTSQPIATTPPSSQLSYKENFEQNNASWSNGGYTVRDANSIVCMDIQIDTPCSDIVHYTPKSANYKMDLTVRFTQTSYIATGNVLCLEERTNTAFPQGVKIGIDAAGDIYNGCLDMSDQNYIGTFHLNVLKEFDVSLSLKDADLSIMVSQQGNNSPPFDLSTLVDTDPGKISIIAYYPVVVSNVAIYTN